MIAEVRHREELKGAWLVDSLGRTIIITRVDTGIIIPLAQGDARVGIDVPADNGHARAIVVRKQIRNSANRLIGRAGLLVNPEALGRTLNRLTIPTRVSLLVSSGSDTIVALGKPERVRQALNEAKRTIRLPNGGAWSLSSSCA